MHGKNLSKPSYISPLLLAPAWLDLTGLLLLWNLEGPQLSWISLLLWLLLSSGSPAVNQYAKIFLKYSKYWVVQWQPTNETQDRSDLRGEAKNNIFLLLGLDFIFHLISDLIKCGKQNKIK